MSAWLPTAPCTPESCVRPAAGQAAAVVRVFRAVTAALAVLAGVPLAFVARWASPDTRTRLTASWSRLVLRALGVRVQVRPGFTFLAGSARPGGGSAGEGVAPLVVANHVSWLDPLVVAASVPGRVLAKREVTRWPVIGLLAAGSGALFIDRDRLTELPGSVAAVARSLRDGQPVIAFPEGTTWCGTGMGRFRPAVFQAALDAGAPVRPVALRFAEGDGTLATAAAFVGEDTLLRSLGRVISARRLVAEVTLLPPVAPPPRTGTAAARRRYAWLAESSVVAPVLHAPGHERTAVPVRRAVPGVPLKPLGVAAADGALP